MNGMTGGGPMIHGKFTNKNTGENIFVKDCIDTGDGIVLTTSIGQIPLKDFMNVYIQMSDEVYDDKGNVVGMANDTPAPIITLQSDNKSLDANDLDIEFVDYSKFENNHIENIITPQSVKETRIQENKKSQSYDMVEKIFNKIQPDLNLQVSFDLDKFPKQEIITLVKYLDVKSDDVANYLYDNYVKNCILEKLQTTISNMVEE